MNFSRRKGGKVPSRVDEVSPHGRHFEFGADSAAATCIILFRSYLSARVFEPSFLLVFVSIPSWTIDVSMVSSNSDLKGSC